MTDVGYTLTRRDRFAVACIDAAVRIGTPEFRRRYRPVADELFTRHYIDPTAKPAYQAPALEAISELDDDADPLDIVRTHLALVVEDRRVRDKARQDAEEQLADTTQTLSETEARATDLDARLAETSRLLEEREAEVGRLQERLSSEVATVQAEHEAETARRAEEHEKELDALRAAHDAELAQAAEDSRSRLTALQEERDLVDGLISERDGALGELSTVRGELDAARGELETHRATLAELTEIATGQLCDENETDEYTIGSNDAAVAILDALAAERTTPDAGTEDPAG